MHPIVRSFRATDLDVLERLVAEMQDFERAIDGRLLAGPEMAPAYTEAMQDRCALYAGEILVAELAGEVAGFVAVQARVPSQELDEPPDTYALVSDLAVAAPQRGRGLGRRLLLAAEDYARKQGAQELRIGVLVGNEVAEQLYRSAGFRPYLHILTKHLTDVLEAP